MIPAPVQPLIDELLDLCAFPDPGTELACAVSGGADSSALLILAAAAQCQVTAHHVDHGAREGSADEATVVAELAARFGADVVCHSAIVAPGPNFEARARTARLALLPSAVATGHTLDDRAETVLINLMRGAARPGLSPMRNAKRHPIVRLRRAETVALCNALEVKVVHDPSNLDPTFLRNRVRHELLPMLDSLSGRDVAAVLDRQADVLGDEDVFLDALAAKLDPTNAKAIASAPVPLARRALRMFIMNEWSLSHAPSNQSVERALHVAKGGATSCEVEGGHRVHRTNQTLRLEPALAKVTLP